jgi:hypothetical protein
MGAFLYLWKINLADKNEIRYKPQLNYIFQRFTHPYGGQP